MTTLRTIPVPEAPGGHHFDGTSTGDGPCYICGRPTKRARYWVHGVHGGDRLLHNDDEAAYAESDDCGDLGMHPVGSGCARLVPADYRRTE